MKMLIADDEINNRLLMRRLLSPLGLCDLVVDGAEAVEAFELAASEGAPYDLVCLDMNMPSKDGDQALREMRILERRLGVPVRHEAVVIMVTGEERQGSALDAHLQGGASGHLVKPVDRDRLFGMLREFGFQLPEEGAEPAPEPPPQTEAPPDFPRIDGVDVAAGLARVGGARELYASFLTHFRKDHLDDVARIETALAAGDSDAARRRAHGVKGVAATICADHLSAMARDLESALKAGDLEAARRALPPFAAALKTVNDSIGVQESHLPVRSNG